MENEELVKYDENLMGMILLNRVWLYFARVMAQSLEMPKKHVEFESASDNANFINTIGWREFAPNEDMHWGVCGLFNYTVEDWWQEKGLNENGNKI